MAAAPGNQYAAKSKQWTMAIERALEKRGKNQTRAEALDALAERLLSLAEQGDMSALKELGDRLEGKPAQSVALSSDPSAPFVVTLRTAEADL